MCRTLRAFVFIVFGTALAVGGADPVFSQSASWSTVDVGSVGVGGSASSNPNGRFKVAGEGTDIWSTADGFFFVYQTLAADGEISARVSSLQNTDGWAKAGLMIRQSLVSGAVNASVVLTPLNGIAFQHRAAVDGATARTSFTGKVPSWLRLVRTEGRVAAYQSADGKNWSALGTQPVPLQGSVFVGLAVTSHRPAKLTNAVFESVSVKASTAPPAGPVAAWAFDEGMGRVARDSAGANDGAVSGAAWTTSGRHGGGLAFDGIDDLVTVPDVPALRASSGVTVSAWLKPLTLAGWRSVAAKEGDNQLAYGVYANSDILRPLGVVGGGTSNCQVAGTTQLPLGTWSHVALTVDGQVARLYVNGAEAGARTPAGALLQTTGALQIGGNSVWGDWFHGTIDDVRVYDRGLSAAEVEADMNTAVPSTPLVDHTPPVVAITSPTPGATVTGVVTVTATAADDIEVAGVQIRVGTASLGPVLTEPPYASAFDATALAAGTYTLTAVATDAAGNEAVSAPVTVTVQNPLPPVANVTALEFTSTDHMAVSPAGIPVIDAYELEIWNAGADPATGTPYRTVSIGKPGGTSSLIRVDQRTFLESLPKGQEFFATVVAAGPGGTARSGPSNTFSLR
jgi:hypothetical protein